MNNGPTVLENLRAAGEAKVRLRGVPFVLLGCMAGFYIALGGVLSQLAGGGLTGAALFPIGLILTVLVGAELFTGNNGVLMPGLLARTITPRQVLTNWLFVYLLNFVGAFVFSLLAYACLYDKADLVATAVAVAERKAGLDFATAFFRGIGANLLVCLAVWLAAAARTFTGKVIGLWIPVFAFVYLGFEHSIANMYFFSFGALCGADISGISINMPASTLGNIVGGAAVGIVYTLCYAKK